jgi:predicted nucleotidyltransferase
MGPPRYDAEVTVTPEQTLAHLRRLEHDRRRRAEVRAERLRERLGSAVAMLRERYGITEARLFGSLASGDVSAESDVDLAVRDLPWECYFEAVADVMERIGGPVDLVRIEEAAGWLRERIESVGQAE